MNTTTPLPCVSCKTPPAAPPETGTLYLRPPADAPDALRRALAAAGVRAAEPTPGVLQVALRPGLLDQLADDLGTALTATEAKATRAVVVADGATPSLADFMNTQSLGALLAGVRHRWLADILRGERLVTHFQPIVSAADPGSVFGHECLTRGVGADGKLVPPGDLFAAARDADLLFGLDRLARLTAIREAVRHAVAGRLFVNFNPSSIYTPSACLRTTFRAVEAAGLDPARIVFEVVESDEVRDTDHLLGILREYRAAGFAVALDDVGAGYSSLNLLAKLRPDFVKLDMGLTRGVDADPYKARVVGKLLEMARDLDIRTVAEGVETVGEWEWVRDHGADLVQGYLFARPACPPAAPKVPAEGVGAAAG